MPNKRHNNRQLPGIMGMRAEAEITNQHFGQRNQRRPSAFRNVTPCVEVNLDSFGFKRLEHRPGVIPNNLPH